MGGQRYMMLGREAIILNYVASAAWKFRDLFGVGATLEWISVPRLNYSLMIDGSPFQQAANPVRSALDMVASTRGSDWFTFNAIVGAWYRPVPSLQFGVAGQVVPNSIETNSTLTVTPRRHDNGAGRHSRATISPANDVSVILPLPLSARAGARYRGLAGTREVFDVELDVEYETWSRVNDFTVDTHGLIAISQDADANLGQIKIPKRWRDTVAVKLGGDVAVIPDRLALRAGAFYETAVAPSSHANVDFAGGAMFGGTVGGSVPFGAWEVALAYQFRRQRRSACRRTPRASTSRCRPAPACRRTPAPRAIRTSWASRPPAVNAGTYNATFHHLSLAVLYRFGW